MGLNPGKKNRKLVDMTIEPDCFEYERRPEAVAEVDQPIYLSKYEAMHQCEWHYQGLVVDFMYNHFVRPDHPDNQKSCKQDVARIDTKHSEVHKHQYFRSGKEQDRIVLVPLQEVSSIGDAEEAIDQCSEACYRDMAENWELHTARWKGESA